MKGTGEHEKKVLEIFDNMLDATDENDLAAAVLTACVVFVTFLEEGDDMLAKGIRHGLFGKDAPAKVTVLNPLSRWITGDNKQSGID